MLYLKMLISNSPLNRSKAGVRLILEQRGSIPRRDILGEFYEVQADALHQFSLVAVDPGSSAS